MRIQETSRYSIYDFYFSWLSIGKIIVVLWLHMDLLPARKAQTVELPILGKVSSEESKGIIADYVNPLLEEYGLAVDPEKIDQQDDNFVCVEFLDFEEDKADKLWKSIDTSKVYAEYWMHGRKG